MRPNEINEESEVNGLINELMAYEFLTAFPPMTTAPQEDSASLTSISHTVSGDPAPNIDSWVGVRDDGGRYYTDDWTTTVSRPGHVTATPQQIQRAYEMLSRRTRVRGRIQVKKQCTCQRCQNNNS